MATGQPQAKLTLDELAQRIGADVRGDGACAVSGCAGLDEAAETDVSFLANRKYVDRVRQSKAAAIIVSPSDADQISGRNLLITEDPYFVFRQAVVALHGFRQHGNAGISELAHVDPTAKIGQGCTIKPFAYVSAGAVVGNGTVIYPHCFIGPDSRIGEDCILYPNVVIYDHCVLGNRVTLHAGCVVGQDGFGYATHDGAHHKIPQIGNVVVEDDVEMGAMCAIDRATVGSTRIGTGSKFSDQVVIGHGTVIGRHNLLVAQVGVAGSVLTGDYVVMGGQVGVAGHLKICDMVQLAAKAGVGSDITQPGQYGGVPAIPFSSAKRSFFAAAKIPKMAAELRDLRKRLAALEESLGDMSES